MIGGAWWWTAKTFASVRDGQVALRTQLVEVINKQVQQVTKAQRDTDLIVRKTLLRRDRDPLPAVPLPRTKRTR
jgi:hypothetical protein